MRNNCVSGVSTGWLWLLAGERLLTLLAVLLSQEMLVVGRRLLSTVGALYLQFR